MVTAVYRRRKDSLQKKKESYQRWKGCGMFKEDFVWGVASSAYQIEGRDEQDGCGISIWDTFCEEGRVYGGQNARVACDHIHRYPEDFALMRTLGVKHYRFSVSWSRLMPMGTGAVNQEGVRLYKDMLHEMKKNGITPYITLFHWEFPKALQDRGGWLNPESVEWFANYARVVAENFGQDCEVFITFNEPQCFLGLGYLRGLHAPGWKRPAEEVFAMTHNMLKAHGAAVKALRSYAGRKIRVGFAPTCGVAIPATDSLEDIEAARECYLGINPDADNWTWTVSWFLDPVVFGKYPEDGLKEYAPYLPEITKEDMELICQPLDFLGQNVYNGYYVRRGEDGGIAFVDRYDGFPKTASQWPVTPECLYWGPKFLYEKYRLPLYITENGMSCHDMPAADGQVHDNDRITFLDKYLFQLQRAADEGADISGYFLWTFLDNFEWDKGYSERFGLVYVDYRDQKRVVKDSAYWYKSICESNGRELSGNRTSREMLFLEPVLKENFWGGSRLITEFPYQSDSSTIGECWGISAHSHGDCRIKEGTFTGMSLSELYEQHRELFGNITAKEFPLLVKIIDARDKLSIQVHPDDDYARVHENGSLGKSECWYIMDCPENASLIIGHNARTKEELISMVDTGRYGELLRRVPIKKGDFIFIVPGTVHSITEGVMLLEIQQSSDITYRVYDYDRLTDGMPRPLHITQSMDVINVPDEAGKAMPLHTGEFPEDKLNLLTQCRYFKIWKLSLRNSIRFEQKEPFLLLSILEGDGVINGRQVSKGCHLILPSGFGQVHMMGNMEVILSTQTVDPG